MSATIREYQRWRAAYVWRRRVEGVLAKSGLRFAEWANLQALEWLIAETGDAVSQSDVACRLELSDSTVSRLMCDLSERGLVDRGGSASGPTWRIFLCQEATALLAAARVGIEAVSSASEKENRRRNR